MFQHKSILILTTGGTIAGSSDDPSLSAHYQAGLVKGSALIASLPPIQSKLSVQEIAQIDSIEMTPQIWQTLLQTLSKESSSYDGFVITHGTDTMEESAFVIDLLYKGTKPVILVGSMRPSNALGSDSAKNLYNAITLASHPKASGVMVLMNDKIYNPQTLYKSHTHNLDAFRSRNSGDLGYMIDFFVQFFALPPRRKWPFELTDLESLPDVPIVYLYAGIQDLPNWQSLHCSPPQGLVIAGCGAGNLPTCIKNQLQLLQDQGTQIVIGSRVNEGVVLESDFIPSFGLHIAKARILLALCLKHSLSKEEIKKIFSLF